jgi:DNA-binding NarL/FixJ family response regulator
MKILIADDHAVIHHGLRRILSDAFAGMVFGEALHSQQALDLAGRESWDLMLLDIDIPIRGGLEVLRHIHISYPKLPVLMFSMYSEEQFAIRSLKAGASGYLVKNCSSEQLLSAVRRVIRGGRYVSDALAEKLAANLNRVARLVPMRFFPTGNFR